VSSKLETLHIIYDLVKDKRQPTEIVLPGNELVLTQKGAWDEIIKNLTELQQAGYVQMQQVSTMFVSITEKGFDYMSKYVSAYG
jgi:predicted transcriptional regulator